MKQSDGLLWMADFFDRIDDGTLLVTNTATGKPVNWTKGDEIQRDLRRWANEAKERGD